MSHLFAYSPFKANSSLVESSRGHYGASFRERDSETEIQAQWPDRRPCHRARTTVTRRLNPHGGWRGGNKFFRLEQT